jgi:endonuclease-3
MLIKNSKKVSSRLQVAQEAFDLLAKRFPEAHCELEAETPFQLLIATILSAQCTDVRVNSVTPHLFAKFPDPQTLAQANQREIEKIIHSTGFYKNKAKNIIACAQQLVTDFHGEVPRNIDELASLAGVGRKTANVVLGNAFGIPSGVVVDTHVKRTAGLIGLTRQTLPEKIESELMKLFMPEQWIQLPHYLIFLGRRICVARRPQCEICPLNHFCQFAQQKRAGKVTHKKKERTTKVVARKAQEKVNPLSP